MNAVVEIKKPGPATQDAAARAVKTILVVDDNENDLALLNLMFRRSRILNPVQTVTSLQSAIRYLSGEGMYADRETYPVPTLLLVDAHLGDGSGFDLLRWLKVHATKSPRAVVMLTGSDVHSFRMSYDLGAHSFLTKPLKFEDFQNMVNHVRGIKLVSTIAGHLLEVE